MRKIYLAILCCCCMHGFTQMSLKGLVRDTNENKPLANAVISLVTQSDSTLVKFTRSKADGSFQINNIPPGKCFVLITYPGYADYVDTIKNDASNHTDIGNLPMIRKSQLLEEVIVRQKIAAIRMKGDTLAYRADSFATRQGATVEDLLKKLPGIQVDRSGKITAQGKQVNKVLVDGEEFFSDDPAVVTKGLPADAVKEVQVFDKKSDQAEFTGIDDGKGSRTINLTLKDDRKKGYFGKAQLGGGTRETFDNSLMLNAFKGKRKFSVFGIMSNTGRDGLDWQESQRFGGGNGFEYDEDLGD
ncbi:MAG: TonB-dependent receptor, partial [Flavitalea sp.]